MELSDTSSGQVKSLAVVDKLSETLLEHDEPISINELSKESGLHFQTVKRYVRLIVKIQQELPRIEEVETRAATFIKAKGLSDLPEERQMSVLRRLVPEKPKKIQILEALAEIGALSKESAVKIKKTDAVKTLLTWDFLEENHNKVHVTKDGMKTLKAAKEIY